MGERGVDGVCEARAFVGCVEVGEDGVDGQGGLGELGGAYRADYEVFCYHFHGVVVGRAGGCYGLVGA